ncbi:MAG: threonine/serine exporter family protein [Myxococcales bacterium]|nr:threonine/serine exporter family protein [Myxococcales bacterium]
MSPRGETSTEERQAIEFVLDLGRVLHRYGTPAHRLEDALQVVSRKLGLSADYFSTPTALIVSFGKPSDLRTTMMAMDAPENNMDKLAKADRLADQVIAGKVDVVDATARLHDIERAPDEWNAPTSIAAYGAAAGSVAVLFAGGWREVVVATFIGTLIGGLEHLMSRDRQRLQIYELVSAVMAALVAGAAARLWPMSSSLVTMAAIVVLLPGLMLTTAMSELATKHLISGTARMFAAITVLLQVVVGVAIGELLAQQLFAANAVRAQALPAWALWPALLVAAIAMAGLVQANRRVLGWIIVAAFAGYLGKTLGSSVLGNNLGALLGAFVLGMLTNLYARLLSRPSQVVQVPAVLILVPGSMGYRGFDALLEHHTMAGVETTFQMFIAATTIVAGLLVANATVAPRRIL